MGITHMEHIFQLDFSIDTIMIRLGGGVDHPDFCGKAWL
jgi:hypothetical protein